MSGKGLTEAQRFSLGAKQDGGAIKEYGTQVRQGGEVMEYMPEDELKVFVTPTADRRSASALQEALNQMMRPIVRECQEARGRKGADKPLLHLSGVPRQMCRRSVSDTLKKRHTEGRKQWFPVRKSLSPRSGILEGGSCWTRRRR